MWKGEYHASFSTPTLYADPASVLSLEHTKMNAQNMSNLLLSSFTQFKYSKPWLGRF